MSLCCWVLVALIAAMICVVALAVRDIGNHIESIRDEGENNGDC